MDGLLPIIAAILSTVGVIIGGMYTTRRLTRFGLSTEQLRVQTTLRELAEVETRKRLIVEAERDAARVALADTQHDLDDCARQRDNAWAALRREGGA